jgi:hypothetical protein
LLKKPGGRRRKDLCDNEGNNANNVSRQTKPAESLLQHDDEDDNEYIDG